MSVIRRPRPLPASNTLPVAEAPLLEPRRKEIFLALVGAQDRAMSVLQSRHVVAKRFRVSDKQVRRIEQEGLDNEWPPL